MPDIRPDEIPESAVDALQATLGMDADAAAVVVAAILNDSTVGDLAIQKRVEALEERVMRRLGFTSPHTYRQMIVDLCPASEAFADGRPHSTRSCRS
ncbi:MAG: hypothetical protein ACYC5V_02115 [Gemmatimonadaceae bacterium]